MKITFGYGITFDMEVLEKIAYHLYVQGIFSRVRINEYIKRGYIRYFNAFMYDPINKELASLLATPANKTQESWQYEGWENDFLSKDRKLEKELLLLFESRHIKKSEATEESLPVIQKPKSVELKLLLKSIRKALESQEEPFSVALKSLLPTAPTWRQAARILADMNAESLFEKLVDVLNKNDSVFVKLWDFLAYDGFLFPDFSGSIITAYKKISSGTHMSRLGQYHWALEHPEIYDVYEIMQAKVSIARAFKTIILTKEKLFLKLLQKEFHSVAYASAVILYSSLRWSKTPFVPPKQDEEVPFWIPLNDLASPTAWTISWHMDSDLTDAFLKHFFEMTYEIQESMYQVPLKAFFKYCEKFEKNVEQAEFTERIKKIVKSGEIKRFNEEEIAEVQKRAFFENEFWSPFFKALPPKKLNEFLAIWWENLTWEALGLGVRWISNEKRWDRRIIEYEVYIDEEKFMEKTDLIIKNFHGVFCPKKWNAS